MTILELRSLTLDHIPAALDLDRRSLGGLWSADSYRREIASPNSDLLIFQPHTPHPPHRSAERSRRSPTPHPPILTLGCCWAILDEAHITILAVDPAYPRQGLGQAMLYTLLKAAHDRGLERATLEVRASNQAAIALYEKFGFQEAGRRKRYYQDTGEDALILWRGKLQYPSFPLQLAEWRQGVSDRLNLAAWKLAPEWDAIGSSASTSL